MVLLGRVFPAQEALEGGLLRILHEPQDLLPAARAIAEDIETMPHRYPLH